MLDDNANLSFIKAGGGYLYETHGML